MDPLGAMVDECDLPVLCFAPGTDFLIYFFDGALSDGIGRFPSPKSKRSVPAGTRPSSTSPLPRRGTALSPVCRSGSAAIAILRCAAMPAGEKAPGNPTFRVGRNDPKQNETARELSLFALEKMNRKANRWTALRKTSQKNAGSACLLFGVMLS